MKPLRARNHLYPTNEYIHSHTKYTSHVLYNSDTVCQHHTAAHRHTPSVTELKSTRMWIQGESTHALFFLTRYHFACAEHVSQFDKGCLCNCRRVGEEWNGNPPAHWCTLWCSMLALCFCPACDWLNLSKRVLRGFNSGTLGASNINLSNNLLRRTCLKVGKTFPVAYL